MRICSICKTENDDRFLYCKNCGTKFPAETLPVTPVKTNTSVNNQAVALVPVILNLPSIDDPKVLMPQTVYVTPAQKIAIENALKKDIKGNE
ncbi:MAG: hypothetical protein E7568_01720 [Ruminococcaceae bacterium]|nr:hypothetical protein [Oscillospiraceae bacterium]